MNPTVFFLFKQILTQTAECTCFFTCYTVETHDKKLHFSVRESGYFLFLGWPYIEFWTRDPIFRSKLLNSGVQRSKIEGLDFLT